MGKGSKKKLHEKEAAGSENESDINNDEEPAASETPLPKLVLKVNKEKKSKTEPPTSDEHGHHKKKKKKHKHKTEEVDKKNRKREATDAPESSEPPPPKKIHWRHREKEKRKVYKEPEISPFRLCLENLHRNLQRKDVYNIFSFPVTDLIAPGYSKIIKQPMDFLTMQKKIEEETYSSLEEFRDDFVLMCNNAMQYNGSDTIYYKNAEKMLAVGIKMLAKAKLKRLNKALGRHVSDSEDDVVQVDDGSDVNIDSIGECTPSPPKKKSHETKKSKREQRESMTASILAAAREAREKLLKNRPKQLYGYLSTDEEGSTSLNILNPDTTQGQKVPVNLGKVAGKLTSGIPAINITFKEEKKSKAVPVNYLLYGPYGSFGPTHDSSLSNISQDETDLLLQTYGSDLGVQYSRSVLEFTKDAPYLQNYVDRLLDAITGNAHSKYKMKTNSDLENDSNMKKSSNEQPEVSEQKKEESGTGTKDDPSEKKKEAEVSPVDVDIESLMTLDGLGIDVSFLKDIVPQKSTSNTSSQQNLTEQSLNPKEKLSETAELLNNLHSSQYQRLSSGALTTNSVPLKEQEIAQSVTNNLKELMHFVSPKDVISSVGVQKAIGFGQKPQINSSSAVASNIVASPPTEQTSAASQQTTIATPQQTTTIE